MTCWAICTVLGGTMDGKLYWGKTVDTWHHAVVVVIAQKLLSYRQLSRLRKSATAAGLSHRACTVSCVGWLWQLNRCSTECGATQHSGQTSDMLLVRRQWPECNWASGTDWPRQQTFKMWDIGWWSSKDSVWYKIRFLLQRLLGCGEYVDSHGKCQHLWCLHLREVQPRCYTSSACPLCFSLGQAEWWDDDTDGVIGSRKASVVWREVLSGI